MPSSPREIPRWRVVLALVLLLGVAILALDALYVMAFGASAPHWLQLPRRRLQGEWALICGATAASWCLRSRSWRSAATHPLFVILVVLLMLLVNTRAMGSGDSRATSYLPFTVGRHLSLTFPEDLLGRDVQEYSFVRATSGALVSKYPVATALLSMPIYLPSIAGPFDVAANRDLLRDLEKLAAAFLAALGAGLLYAAFRRHWGTRAAYMATLVHALGTAMFSVVGQGLWQHAGAAFFFSVGVWGLLSIRDWRLLGACVGFACAGAIASRPICVIPAMSFAVALLFVDRRSWLTAAPVAGVIGVLLLSYNLHFFGGVFATGYGAEAANAWTTPWLEGILGLLLSPGRGLFVFSPVIVFAFVALFRGSPQIPSRWVPRALGLGALGYIAVMARWSPWHGAYSAGPRMYSDVLPILALGLVLALASIRTQSRRRAFQGLAAYSGALHLLITLVPPPTQTRDLLWLLTEGPWSPRAYPPVAYWVGSVQRPPLSQQSGL